MISTSVNLPFIMMVADAARNFTQLMKKTTRIVFLLTAVLALHSCELFSAVGIDNSGLPVKKANSTDNSVQIGQEVMVDHSKWDSLLKACVSADGKVDYKRFLKQRNQLKQYLNMLSEKEPDENWSVEELLAYYINTYNAYTVDLILEHYPVESIKDISRAWTKKIIPIGSNNISLGNLEHDILRKMEEPRIHFAINCASYSCPKLLNEAYTADKLESQLERVTYGFINSDENDIDSETPELSSIFKWFEKDFKVNGKTDVIAFVNRYSIAKIDPKAKIRYKDYDWNLNE